MEVKLHSFLPGWNYSISVQAISKKSESTKTVIYLVTRPARPIIKNVESVEGGFNLSWETDPKSRQEKFNITYRPTSITRYEETSTTQSHINLTHLDPGVQYEIQVIAVSYKIKSKPVSQNQTVAPRPPRDFSIEKVWSNGVLVQWKEPQNSRFTGFFIWYKTEDTSWRKLPRSKSDRDAEIDDLTPGELYIIRINTVSDLVESIQSPRVNQTIPPKHVLNFTATFISTNVTLEWLRPEGRIETYLIEWWQVNTSLDIRTENKTENHVSAVGLNDNFQMKRELNIGDLMPGVQYSCSIKSVSHNSVSNQTKMGFKIPVLAPPRPRPQDVPTNLRRSSTVIEIKIRQDYFSEENGKIISYSIIVAENYSMDASRLRLLSWYEVQKYSVWPPYEVKVPYDLFKDGSVADFRIGDGRCDGEMGFCNGPLKPGSTYAFKIRVFTAADKFADTNYGLPIKTEPTAGEGLDAEIIRRIGNYTDIQVTWDSPKSFPDFYIVNLNLNGLKSDDPPSRNVSGTETGTRFLNVTISGGFTVHVRAWTSGVEGLPISKRCESLQKCIRRTSNRIPDLVLPLCLASGVAMVIGIGIAVYRYFRLRRPRLQSQNHQLDEYEVSSERLTVTRVLGNGAFGMVKLGSLRDDHGNLTNVAVKMLRDDSNENDLRSFLAEMKIMKVLDKHPNVVSLVGCCTIGPYPLLVVEYCSRGDLHSFLRKSLEGGTSPVEEARKCTVISKTLPKREKMLKENCAKSSTCRNDDDYVRVSYSDEDQDTNRDPDIITVLDMLNFGRQIATGMVFLSSNRIVHRDLAARNVLVCYDRTVKISDFGLSRDIYQENFYKKSGNGRMPLKWMAIEALTHQLYSTHSDVWSFGILLWEIVTLGGVPYPGVPTLELLKRLQSGYRMERPENCSIRLYDVMLSCWQTRSRDRPTFSGLCQELEELISVTTENDYCEVIDVSEQVSAEPSSTRLENIV